MNEIAGANTQRDRQLFLASDLVELGEIDDLDISHASGGDRRPRYPPLRFPRSPFDRKSAPCQPRNRKRSEEHTSELQSLMRISYAVFCLKKKNNNINYEHTENNKLEKYRKLTRREIHQ